MALDHLKDFVQGEEFQNLLRREERPEEARETAMNEAAAELLRGRDLLIEEYNENGSGYHIMAGRQRDYLHAKGEVDEQKKALRRAVLKQYGLKEEVERPDDVVMDDVVLNTKYGYDGTEIEDEERRRAAEKFNADFLMFLSRNYGDSYGKEAVSQGLRNIAGGLEAFSRGDDDEDNPKNIDLIKEFVEKEAEKALVRKMASIYYLTVDYLGEADVADLSMAAYNQAINGQIGPDGKSVPVKYKRFFQDIILFARNGHDEGPLDIVDFDNWPVAAKQEFLKEFLLSKAEEMQEIRKEKLFQDDTGELKREYDLEKLREEYVHKIYGFSVEQHSSEDEERFLNLVAEKFRGIKWEGKDQEHRIFNAVLNTFGDYEEKRDAIAFLTFAQWEARRYIAQQLMVSLEIAVEGKISFDGYRTYELAYKDALQFQYGDHLKPSPYFIEEYNRQNPRLKQESLLSWKNNLIAIDQLEEGPKKAALAALDRKFKEVVARKSKEKMIEVFADSLPKELDDFYRSGSQELTGVLNEYRQFLLDAIDGKISREIDNLLNRAGFYREMVHEEDEQKITRLFSATSEVDRHVLRMKFAEKSYAKSLLDRTGRGFASRLETVDHFNRKVDRNVRNRAVGEFSKLPALKTAYEKRKALDERLFEKEIDDYCYEIINRKSRYVDGNGEPLKTSPLAQGIIKQLEDYNGGIYRDNIAMQQVNISAATEKTESLRQLVKDELGKTQEKLAARVKGEQLRKRLKRNEAAIQIGAGAKKALVERTLAADPVLLGDKEQLALVNKEIDANKTKQAITIQRVFRGWQARKEVRKLRVEKESELQRAKDAASATALSASDADDASVGGDAGAPAAAGTLDAAPMGGGGAGAGSAAAPAAAPVAAAPAPAPAAPPPDPDQLAKAKDAWEKAQNESDWPRRLFRNSYAKEVETTHKYRAKIDAAGVLTLEDAANTMQDKSITQITGNTAGFLSTASRKALKEFYDRDDDGINRGDDIEYERYGFARANYYSDGGFINLQEDVRRAADYYSEHKLGEDECHVSYARVHRCKDGAPASDNPTLLDRNQFVDVAVIATSSGVTQVFTDQSVNKRQDEIAKEFYEKKGEDLMLKALEKVGAFSLAGAPVAGVPFAPTQEYTEAYAKKEVEAAKLVRTLVREHAMGEMKKEVMAAQAVQYAQGLTPQDYKNLEDYFRGYTSDNVTSPLDLAASIYDKKLFSGSSLVGLQAAITDLRTIPDPVSGYKGIAYSHGPRRGAVKVSFTSKDIDVAYPYIPESPNCHVRMRVATNDGPMTYYDNGKPVVKNFKKGEIVMDVDTIFHYDAKTGGYVRYGINPKTNLNPFSSSKTDFEERFSGDVFAIRSNLKNMLIQGSSDIDGSRGVIIKGKGVVIAKKLSPSLALDVTGKEILFRKKLPDLPPVAAPAAPAALAAAAPAAPAFPSPAWDPQEIFVKCPDLDLDGRSLKEIRDGKSKSGKPLKAVTAAVAEARKDAIIKICIADKDGEVELNDGKKIYVKQGCVYRQPIPYHSDGNGGYVQYGDPQGQLGSDFLSAMRQVKTNEVAIDEYKHVERELRNAIRDSNVTKVNEILTKYKDLFAAKLLDINAVENVSCKSALHLAVENSSMWQMEGAALKADSIVAKLLAFGADPSKRCSVTVQGSSLGLSASGLAAKRGAPQPFVNALRAKELEMLSEKTAKLIAAATKATAEIEAIRKGDGQKLFDDIKDIGVGYRIEARSAVGGLRHKGVDSALEDLKKEAAKFNDAKTKNLPVPKVDKFAEDLAKAHKKLEEALRKQAVKVDVKMDGLATSLGNGPSPYPLKPTARSLGVAAGRKAAASVNNQTQAALSNATAINR